MLDLEEEKKTPSRGAHHKLNSTTTTHHHRPPPTHQVCETSANVVDIKIGTGFVSNVKVILSTPNATIAGLEFVVTDGKKSASTFCGRALGLSAWIGTPGQAVGAIGGTCTAPASAARRRRGRSILGEQEEEHEEQGAEQPQPEVAAAVSVAPQARAGPEQRHDGRAERRDAAGRAGPCAAGREQQRRVRERDDLWRVKRGKRG